jgi:ribosome-associated heat shock protein Hsp15
LQRDAAWQRLDMWLWCARFMKSRGDCADWIAGGSLRLNRQPTDKAHARLRVGDVLTLPLRGGVRVVRVVALAERRGPAAEARLLYADLAEDGALILPPAPAASSAPDRPPSGPT